MDRSRRSSTATTRTPATTGRTCCSSASSTNCRSRASRRASCRMLVKNWQINGIGSWLSGTPFTVGGDNGLLQQQGGQQTANVTGELAGRLRRGRSRRAVVRPDRSSASRATPGATAAATRSAARRTGTSTSRCSAPSRSAATASSSVPSRTNVFNHAQWGNPVTGITDPNFMRIRTLARDPRTRAAGTALPVLDAGLRSSGLRSSGSVRARDLRHA